MNRYKNTPPIKRDPPCACGSGKPAYLRYVDGKLANADCCDTCWETHTNNPKRKNTAS